MKTGLIPSQYFDYGECTSYSPLSIIRIFLLNFSKFCMMLFYFVLKNFLSKDVKFKSVSPVSVFYSTKPKMAKGDFLCFKLWVNDC